MQYIKHVITTIQAKYVVMVGIFAPITRLVEKYLFNDWDFLTFLAILITIDVILGFGAAYKNKVISARKFGDLMVKVIIYGCFLVTIHVCVNVTTEQGHRLIFLNWFDSLGYSAIIVREAISIVENANKLKPGIIPDIISKRLRSIEEKELS